MLFTSLFVHFDKPLPILLRVPDLHKIFFPIFVRLPPCFNQQSKIGLLLRYVFMQNHRCDFISHFVTVPLKFHLCLKLMAVIL